MGAITSQARSQWANITHASLYRSSQHLPTFFDRLGALSEPLNLGNVRVMMGAHCWHHGHRSR